MLFRILLASFAVLHCITALESPTCSLVNDPRLTTFYNQKKKLAAVPCMSQVTEGQKDVFLNIDMLTSAPPPELVYGDLVKVGVCSYKVFSYNVRAKGKMYQGGYKLEIKFKSSLEGVHDKEVGLGVNGKGYYGTYEYELIASVNLKDWEPFDSAKGHEYSILGDNVNFERNPETQLVSLDYRDAGVRIEFRAADTYYSVFEQPYVPGVTVIVDDEHSIQDPNGISLCLLPHQSFRDIRVRSFPPETTLLLRSLPANPDLVPQVFPGVSETCSTLPEIMDSCYSKGNSVMRAALIRCTKLLLNDGFMGCYSAANPEETNGDSIMKLVESCIRGECRLGRGRRARNRDCDTFVSQLTSSTYCYNKVANDFEDSVCIPAES